MATERPDKTIGEFIRALKPDIQRRARCPGWPPDCFAIGLSLLKATCAYTDLLAEWPPTGETFETWTKNVRERGRRWQDAWRFGKRFHDLDNEWRIVLDKFDDTLALINRDPDLRAALMTLVAVADEAFDGVGAIVEESGADKFLDEAARVMAGGSLSTIHWTRLTVLPKMHTPQKGLSDRSLSLNLALYDSSEVLPQWQQGSDQHLGDAINLLIIPWPFEVLVQQFRPVSASAAQTPGRFGFFTYQVEQVAIDDLIELVERLHSETKRKLGRVDGILMPELALTEDQFEALRSKFETRCFLVCGVGAAATGSVAANQRGSNDARYWFIGGIHDKQSKHHPWTIDEQQVIQYGIGATLAPNRTWRECIKIAGRTLNFIALRNDFVVSVLICEDLARPDPVANLVRAVGPNLVLGLLMDGPQLKDRWAARYATVLADDPGCSVLAVTSLGMAKLSSPKSGPNRCRVVAIWKDAFDAAKEIELPEGAQGLALTLSVKESTEYSADGRTRSGFSSSAVLVGVHPVFLSP